MEIVDEYLAELTRRMREILGEELLAIYTGGSYALRHDAVPCPARGLELVVYALATVQQSTGAPGFELNLNTGARMDFRADHEPGEIEDFWFAIDRSIVR